MPKPGRGGLDMLILATLARAEAPQHGYGLIRSLSEASGGYFDYPEGTIYPVLHELEQQRLVRSRWSAESGRRRRVYAVTPGGRAALHEKSAAWGEYASAVAAILGSAP